MTVSSIGPHPPPAAMGPGPVHVSPPHPGQVDVALPSGDVPAVVPRGPAIANSSGGSAGSGARVVRPSGGRPSSTHPTTSLSSGAAAPCALAHARLTEAFPGVRIQHGPPRTGDGWIGGAELLHDRAALRELISFDARQGPARYGRPLRPDVAAGFCLYRYCWPVGLLFTLPWFLERRVPVLPAEAVSIRRRTGELTALVGAFACLPDDPAAGLPGARVVADAAALRAELLSALAQHLTPVLAAFRPEVRRGPHTLGAMATDAVVEGLWQVATLLGEEDRAVDALSWLLPGHGGPHAGPFVGGAGFRFEERDGAAPVRTRTRAGCCLLYTVRTEDSCVGCPRVTRG